MDEQQVQPLVQPQRPATRAPSVSRRPEPRSRPEPYTGSETIPCLRRTCGGVEPGTEHRPSTKVDDLCEIVDLSTGESIGYWR